MGTLKKRTKHTIPAKYILTFLSCGCALLIIVSFISEPFGNTIKNSAAQIVVPVQKGMNHVGLWLADKSDTIKEYAKLQDENKELKQKLEDTQSKNSIRFSKANWRNYANCTSWMIFTLIIRRLQPE